MKVSSETCKAALLRSYFDPTRHLTLRFALVHEQNGTSYFGALVGRVANRVGKGRFVLDGKAYHLYINDGKNAMHGTVNCELIILRPLFPKLMRMMRCSSDQ
jgi:galactose mutarotase-like enzyme